ncbi:MAG: DUF3623 domain-containing protein [Chloroflexi bacterium]|nr:DUF3623 domain-containing protein [Chloroflexota bacterium]
MYIFPIVYAILLWWFSTGLILSLYGRSRKLMRLGFGLGTLLTGFAVTGLIATRDQTQTLDVYFAVTCGVTIWGWQMASYYLGFVTGPRPKPAADTRSDDDMSGFGFGRRFRLALQFSLYHEILVLVVAGLLTVLMWSHANLWGLWIYLVLWLMHTSAKLNVFLGVRNFRIELLPRQLHYLGNLLGKQSSNPLFPVSVMVASTALLGLVYQGTLPSTDAAQTTGFFLLATMITLGLLEHWFLMLPLPANIWGLAIHHVPLPVEHNNDVSTTVDSTNKEVIKGPVP